MSVHEHLELAEHHAKEADGYAEKAIAGGEIETAEFKACEMHRRMSHLHVEIARTTLDLAEYIKRHKQNPTT
jgi:hypothetical protein